MNNEELEKINKIIRKCPRPDLIKIVDLDHHVSLQLNYKIINIKEAICPCGHIHKPSSDGSELRTYCVEGSACNSDKCAEFVKGRNDDGN